MISRPVLLSLFLAAVIISPVARGQSALEKTTLGKSNNDYRDMQNSLTAAPAPKYGKGEKKLELSAAELKTKALKDSTFGGSLLNMGIDRSEPKLDESKLRTAPTETQSKPQLAATEKEPAVEKQPAAVEKQSSASSKPAEFAPVFSSMSTTAALADKLGESGANAPADKNSATSSNSSTGDTQKKDQTGTAAAETPKPDGDH